MMDNNTNNTVKHKNPTTLLKHKNPPPLLNYIGNNTKTSLLILTTPPHTVGINVANVNDFQCVLTRIPIFDKFDRITMGFRRQMRDPHAGTHLGPQNI